MNYNKIISYIYALLAVGYGTYFYIMYIYYYKLTLDGYYSKNKEETIAIIKTINCYDNSCYSNLEYIVNNIKYMNVKNIKNNLKIGDKIKIKYTIDNPNEIFVYGNQHIYAFIYIILFIIFILLLWIFLFIVILYKNNYNKFIFLIYAIFITIIISDTIYFNINRLYEYQDYIINANHNNENDLDNYYYDNFENYTIGIIKNQDEYYSNVEYLVDGFKYNIKILTIDYKIGEEVKVYYNKDYPEAIKIYDETKSLNKKEIKQIKIILYIILLLLWIFLFFNIPIIII
jgi:hypothetical protein